MDGKIRFGLAGCGRISHKHASAILALSSEAELICVCDLVRERADAIAQQYLKCISDRGKSSDANFPRIYSDIGKMIDSEKLDVLSICTPSGLHPVHGIMAAGRGINVLSEKPIATAMKQADELIDACDKAGVKLFVVKQNRLNSTVQLLKKAIDKGRFGKIYMILSNVLWFRPQSYYSLAEWRGTWELDGGAFCNQASHYIDIVQWLGGPVESVCAYTGTLDRRIEAEDSGCAVMKFRNGAIGNVNVTTLVYPENLEGSITVIGEKGTARIGGTSLNRIEKWEFEGIDEDDKTAAESCYEPPDVYGYGHKGCYENVIGALRGNDVPFTDGREARKSLEIIMGIRMSSHKGRRVYFPIDLDDGMRGALE